MVSKDTGKEIRNREPVGVNHLVQGHSRAVGQILEEVSNERDCRQQPMQVACAAVFLGHCVGLPDNHKRGSIAVSAVTILTNMGN